MAQTIMSMNNSAHVLGICSFFLLFSISILLYLKKSLAY